MTAHLLRPSSLFFFTTVLLAGANAARMALELGVQS